MTVGNRKNSLLTAMDLAKLLHVHINTVRRWTNQGILKTYRVGPRGDRRFSKEDIALFLADNHAVPRSPEREHLPLR